MAPGSSSDAYKRRPQDIYVHSPVSQAARPPVSPGQVSTTFVPGRPSHLSALAPNKSGSPTKDSLLEYPASNPRLLISDPPTPPVHVHLRPGVSFLGAPSSRRSQSSLGFISTPLIWQGRKRPSRGRHQTTTRPTRLVVNITKPSVRETSTTKVDLFNNQYRSTTRRLSFVNRTSQPKQKPEKPNPTKETPEASQVSKESEGAEEPSSVVGAAAPLASSSALSNRKNKPVSPLLSASSLENQMAATRNWTNPSPLEPVEDSSGLEQFVDVITEFSSHEFDAASYLDEPTTMVPFFPEPGTEHQDAGVAIVPVLQDGGEAPSLSHSQQDVGRFHIPTLSVPHTHPSVTPPLLMTSKPGQIFSSPLAPPPRVETSIIPFSSSGVLRLFSSTMFSFPSDLNHSPFVLQLPIPSSLPPCSVSHLITSSLSSTVSPSVPPPPSSSLSFFSSLAPRPSHPAWSTTLQTLASLQHPQQEAAIVESGFILELDGVSGNLLPHVVSSSSLELQRDIVVRRDDSASLVLLPLSSEALTQTQTQVVGTTHLPETATYKPELFKSPLSGLDDIKLLDTHQDLVAQSDVDLDSPFYQSDEAASGAVSGVLSTGSFSTEVFRPHLSPQTNVVLVGLSGVLWPSSHELGLVHPMSAVGITSKESPDSQATERHSSSFTVSPAVSSSRPLSYQNLSPTVFMQTLPVDMTTRKMGDETAVSSSAVSPSPVGDGTPVMLLTSSQTRWRTSTLTFIKGLSGEIKSSGAGVTRALPDYHTSFNHATSPVSIPSLTATTPMLFFYPRPPQPTSGPDYSQQVGVTHPGHLTRMFLDESQMPGLRETQDSFSFPLKLLSPSLLSSFSASASHLSLSSYITPSLHPAFSDLTSSPVEMSVLSAASSEFHQSTTTPSLQKSTTHPITDLQESTWQFVTLSQSQAFVLPDEKSSSMSSDFRRSAEEQEDLLLQASGFINDAHSLPEASKHENNSGKLLSAAFNLENVVPKLHVAVELECADQDQEAVLNMTSLCPTYHPISEIKEGVTAAPLTPNTLQNSGLNTSSVMPDSGSPTSSSTKAQGQGFVSEFPSPENNKPTFNTVGLKYNFSSNVPTMSEPGWVQDPQGDVKGTKLAPHSSMNTGTSTYVSGSSVNQSTSVSNHSESQNPVVSGHDGALGLDRHDGHIKHVSKPVPSISPHFNTSKSSTPTPVEAVSVSTGGSSLVKSTAGTAARSPTQDLRTELPCQCKQRLNFPCLCGRSTVNSMSEKTNTRCRQ